MPKAAVITISDSRSTGQSEDKGGPAVVEALTRLGFDIGRREIVPDESDVIRETVRRACAEADLLITTGGTGIAPRDITPEALEPLFDRVLPGFGEIMRTGTFSKTPLSIISRGGGGVIGRTLVVMLPGSPKGVKDCLEILGPAIQHVVKVLREGPMDCQGQPGTTKPA